MYRSYNRKQSESEIYRSLRRFFSDFQITLTEQQLKELVDVYDKPETFNRLKNRILLGKLDPSNCKKIK